MSEPLARKAPSEPFVLLAALAGGLVALGAVAGACELAPFAVADRSSPLLLEPGPLGSASLLSWLLAHASALLPLGPLSFRITLAIALCSVVAVSALYRALHRLLATRVRSPWAAPLALGLALALLAVTGALDSHPRLHVPAVMLACLALEALACTLFRERSRRGALRTWLWVTALGLELFLGSRALPSSGAAHADDCPAADLLSELDRRALPARSALLLRPQALLGFEAQELEERLRPDVAALPKPWPIELEDAMAIAREHPELKPLARAAVLAGELPMAQLRELAAARPVLLQLEPEERELYESVVPVGLQHQLLTSTVTRSELRAYLKDNEARQARLLSRLAPARLSNEARKALAQRLRGPAEHLKDRGEDPARARLAAQALPWLDPQQ